MNTDIDKKQLKIISIEFRTIANRLINCNHQTGMDILKKFIYYIDNNELIRDFIKEFTDESDFQPIERGDCFISMGDNKQEEISCTYQYLKYCNDNYNDFYYDIAMPYGSDSKDSIKEFCNRIILPFVNYIEGYLTEIGIKMGYDEDIKYVINVSGGIAQVNVASDRSNINANQNNGLDFIQLEKLIKSIYDTKPSNISESDQEQIDESIEVIRNELQKDKPKKSLIKTSVKGLQAIKGTVEFITAIAALYEFLQPLI